MNITLQKVSNNQSLRFFSLILFFCISGCKPNQENQNRSIDQILNIKGTEPLSHKHHHALDSIRGLIDKKDVRRLIKFYNAKSFYYSDHTSSDSLNRYVDSAVALFNDKKLIQENKQSYFDALLLKGDALYLARKYSQAVLYYLEARSFQQKNLDDCAKKGLMMRIGNVYYVQSKFAQAISYFKACYELELRCKTNSTDLKQFYDIQALLNTIGFSYERGNMLDSARFFYQKDLDFIKTSRSTGKIPDYALNDASSIAMDNLGSVYLKQGELSKSRELLLKSIAIDYSGGDDAKVPPMIKVANLYLQTGRYQLAESMLAKADSILKVKPDIEFLARWNQTKSALCYRLKNYKLAFDFQTRHLLFRDSANKQQLKLSSINVEKDFANLEQKYELQDLEKKDAIKNGYLVFAAFLLLLVVIIVFLLLYNIKQSRKSNLITQLHNEELTETLLKLEDANQNYARVMKVMAHDLRNPIGGISGISSLLIEDNQLPQNEKETIETIKSSADHALGMINEILNAVLTKDDAKELLKEPVALRNLIEQCVSLLKFKADEKNQKLLIYESSEVIIQANKEKLWRVFNNIIVNGIKFSHPNATIAIDIEQSITHVKVAIIDQGIGIPTLYESKIFDIFTEAKRLGTSGEKPYGLGLSISKQIVEAHNGKLWYENNPSGGTIFFIQLPIS